MWFLLRGATDLNEGVTNDWRNVIMTFVGA